MAIKEKIRAQYDARKCLWKIVKKTNNGSGGWRRFGANWYATQQLAEQSVENITQKFPQFYVKG